MRIALTGNPNSGKTTMFNALTGRSERVGNWAGVTVDKKEHPIKKNYCPEGEELIAVDLPGAYSMSPFTSEESITSDYVKNENPDVLVNIVDGTNLSRSLFFTTQLLELGIPMVVALNKADVNTKKQTKIDVAALAQQLGCPVVETVADNGSGLERVINAAVAQIGKVQKAPYAQGDVDMSSRKAVVEADHDQTGGCCAFEPVELTQIIMEKGNNSMRIAVTYENGEVYQHFGHTEQFKLYDVEDGKVVRAVVVDTNGSGHGALATFLRAFEVDTLICGGIGGGAINALTMAGIDLYPGISGSADMAVMQLIAGVLPKRTDVRCSHHDHHGEGHDCGSHGHTCGNHGCH